MTATLIVLAKKPRPGRVKTRLCPPYSPRDAARLAQAALSDTLDAAASVAGVRHVLATDMPFPLSRTEFTIIQQRGEGLGERLATVFADVAEQHTGPVFLIGMDTPQVTAHLLTDCIGRLDEHAAVLGMARDGGWWALGLQDPVHAAVLADIPMSTSDTGRMTERALTERGLQVAPLPVLRDLDTADDIPEISLAAAGARFPATVRELRDCERYA